MPAATDEPRRYAAVDALAVIPAVGAALSLVGSVAALGVWTLDAAGSLTEAVGVAGIASCLLAAALATLAFMASLAQLVWVAANRRSMALPTTALLLSIAVLVACLAMPVAMELASRYRPAPTALSNFSALAVPLTAPWLGMNLPTNGGSALYSDGTTLTLVHNGAQGASLASTYDRHLRSLGWSSTYTSNLPNMWTQTYSQGGKTLTLAVIEDTSNAFTAVSLVMM